MRLFRTLGAGSIMTASLLLTVGTAQAARGERHSDGGESREQTQNSRQNWAQQSSVTMHNDDSRQTKSQSNSWTNAAADTFQAPVKTEKSDWQKPEEPKPAKTKNAWTAPVSNHDYESSKPEVKYQPRHEEPKAQTQNWTYTVTIPTVPTVPVIATNWNQPKAEPTHEKNNDWKNDDKNSYDHKDEYGRGSYIPETKHYDNDKPEYRPTQNWHEDKNDRNDYSYGNYNHGQNGYGYYVTSYYGAYNTWDYNYCRWWEQNRMAMSADYRNAYDQWYWAYCGNQNSHYQSYQPVHHQAKPVVYYHAEVKKDDCNDARPAHVNYVPVKHNDCDYRDNHKPAHTPVYHPVKHETKPGKGSMKPASNGNNNDCNHRAYAQQSNWQTQPMHYNNQPAHYYGNGGYGYSNTTNNNNNVSVNNSNWQNAQSGNATVSGNTWGGSAWTGNATNNNSTSTNVTIHNM